MAPAKRLEAFVEAGEPCVRIEFRQAPLHFGKLRLQGCETREYHLCRRILLGIKGGKLIRDLGKRVCGRILEGGDPVAERRLARGMGGAERVKPFGEAVKHPLRVLRGECLHNLGKLFLQRCEPGKDRLHRRILLRIERSELIRNLREGIRAGVLQRREPVFQRRLARGMGGTERVKPFGEAVEHPLRILRGEGLLKAVELGFQRCEPGKDRLHRRILLRIERSELIGNLREGIRVRIFQRGEALCGCGLARGMGKAQGLEPLGNALEGGPGLRHRRPLADPGEFRLHRREAGGDLVLAPVHRIEPCGQAALDPGKPRLERAEPGEHRLHRRILLGVERGELFGDLGERVRGRIFQRGNPVLEGSLARGMKRPEALQPLGEGREQPLRAHLDHVLLDRLDPSGNPLDHLRLLGPEGCKCIAEGRHPPEPGLQFGQRAAGLDLIFLKCGELGLEAGEHGIAAGTAALDLAQPPLDRAKPVEQRFDGIVLLGIEPGELLGDLREGIHRRGLEHGHAPLDGRRRRGMGALHLVEPRREPVDEAARFRELAHLFERPKPCPKLVEPGQRRLEGGVLVPDQAQKLTRHGLKALLRRVLLRDQRIDPSGEIGLQRLDGGKPGLGAAPPAALADGFLARHGGRSFGHGAGFDLADHPPPAPGPEPGGQEQQKPCQDKPRLETEIERAHYRNPGC